MPHDASSENSKKLDRLIVWIDGDHVNPGVVDRLRLIETTLFGKEGKGGLVSQHNIMWRAHVWLLCTLSGALGAAITLLIQKLVKII